MEESIRLWQRELADLHHNASTTEQKSGKSRNSFAIVDGKQIEVLRGELLKLGAAHGEELARLAETVRSEMADSWNTDNRI